VSIITSRLIYWLSTFGLIAGYQKMRAIASDDALCGDRISILPAAVKIILLWTRAGINHNVKSSRRRRQAAPLFIRPGAETNSLSACRLLMAPRLAGKFIDK
jgi:hypothetical protein